MTKLLQFRLKGNRVHRKEKHGEAMQFRREKEEIPRLSATGSSRRRSF